MPKWRFFKRGPKMPLILPCPLKSRWFHLFMKSFSNNILNVFFYNTQTSTLMCYILHVSGIWIFWKYIKQYLLVNIIPWYLFYIYIQLYIIRLPLPQHQSLLAVISVFLQMDNEYFHVTTWFIDIFLRQLSIDIKIWLRNK
jgi:hypothetical protein